MVLTVTAPLWADMSDRPTRQLGTVYGLQDLSAQPKKLPIAGNDGVMVSSKPWWSRRSYGQVCVLDDFEGTFKWGQLAGTVTKASDPTFVNEGTSAMKLVTSNIAGQKATAVLYATPLHPWVTFTTMELWFCLSAAADATPQDFYIEWVIADEPRGVQMILGVRYLNYDAGVLTERWQYKNNTGAWAWLPTTANSRLGITIPEFHYLRLTISKTAATDFMYNSLYVDNLWVDMVTYTGQSGAYSINDQQIRIGCTTDVAAVTTAYVDDFIIHSGTY